MNMRNKSKKHSFQPDIVYMMEALGFNEVPSETLDTLEDILINYVIDLYNEALRSCELHGRTKVKFEDIKFAVRQDIEKLHRMDEISRNLKIINMNKKAFDSKNKHVKEPSGLVESTGPKLTASGRPRKKYKKRAKKKEDEVPKKKRKYTKRAPRFQNST